MSLTTPLTDNTQNYVPNDPSYGQYSELCPLAALLRTLLVIMSLTPLLTDITRNYVPNTSLGFIIHFGKLILLILAHYSSIFNELSISLVFDSKSKSDFDSGCPVSANFLTLCIWKYHPVKSLAMVWNV